MSESVARGLGAKQQLGYAAAVLGLIGVCAGLIWAFRSFGPISTYFAASSSMEPTLHQGDVVLARGARARCGFVTPQLGDVVVFQRDQVHFLGRVIAGPGQTVALRQGRVVVDGVQFATSVQEPWTSENGVRSTVVRETHPNGRSYRTLDTAPDTPLDEFGPRRLASDEWLPLGDHRDNAADGRVSGPVKQSDVCGVILRIVSSTEAANVGRRP